MFLGTISPANFLVDIVFVVVALLNAYAGLALSEAGKILQYIIQRACLQKWSHQYVKEVFSLLHYATLSP